MKVSKSGISLAVLTVLISNSFAADTLANAFKEGKVNGTLKSMYRDADISGQDSSGFALGGELGYVTGNVNGFGAGVTFQTSHTMGLKDNNSAEVDGSVAISETMLSEAYLSYTFDKTVVKVGRQYIDTPLVSSSSSRMLNGMFQAITVTNTSLPETTLIAGAINKWQYRAEKIQDLDEEIYTFYALNKSIKGLELTAQGTVHKDDRSASCCTSARWTSATRRPPVPSRRPPPSWTACVPAAGASWSARTPTAPTAWCAPTPTAPTRPPSPPPGATAGRAEHDGGHPRQGRPAGQVPRRARQAPAPGRQRPVPARRRRAGPRPGRPLHAAPAARAQDRPRALRLRRRRLRRAGDGRAAGGGRHRPGAADQSE